MTLDEVKWWEEHARLWDSLVPEFGQAETVQGELIRCTGKLTDEAYRNGNANWDSHHEWMTKFIAKTLVDGDTFSGELCQKIQAAADEILRDFDNPDVSGHGSAYYFLTEMAVRWCIANPEPVPHIVNKDLRR